MLNNTIRNDSLFQELQPFADALDLDLVDVQKHVHGPSDVQVAVVVSARGRDTSIEDCEQFHRSVQPRLELEIGRDILSMEVSTPGLQRNLRDFWEFTIFNGKRCRVYVLSRSQWVEGDICMEENNLSLENWVIEDTQESGDKMEILPNDIQKAKLEFKFVNKKSGDK